MIAAPSPPARQTTSERELYRREAIDFQRYRFVGEPLRTGQAALLPVAVAVLLLLSCIAAILMARHRPTVSGRIVDAAARSLVIALDGRRAAGRFGVGDRAQIALGSAPSVPRTITIVAVWPDRDGRTRVRVAPGAGGAFIGISPGQRVAVTLASRPAVALP
ncbi:hypothetical protein DBR17_07065 [Sphingomonas sp. HMWF008]|nr:hypothetical protein DBR17_07065 [Sphingomonas sp. HMWF008]